LVTSDGKTPCTDGHPGLGLADSLYNNGSWQMSTTNGFFLGGQGTMV